MNYQEAKTLLARGKHVLHSNLRTTLEQRDNGAIALKLVNTDVVTYYPDGRIVLNSGGWLTATTKKRMNDYQEEAIIYQEKGQWFAITRDPTGNGWALDDDPVPFADGITFWPDGTIEGAADQEEINKRRKLAKQVNAYAKAYALALVNCEIPAPTSGDCFYCYHDWGRSDHLESHIEEKYYVPSLLYRAMIAYPVAPLVQQLIGYVWSGDYSRADVDDNFGFVVGVALDQIKSTIRRYMRHELEL